MTQCLQQLQKTNPSLLLTASELRKAERDARYVPAVALALASILNKSVIDPDPAILERIQRWDTNISIPTQVVTLSAGGESPRSLSPTENALPAKGFNTVAVEALGMLIEGQLRLALSRPGKAKKKIEKDDEEQSQTSEGASLDSPSMHIDWDLLEQAKTGGNEIHADKLESSRNGESVPQQKRDGGFQLDDATVCDYDEWL